MSPEDRFEEYKLVAPDVGTLLHFFDHRAISPVSAT